MKQDISTQERTWETGRTLEAFYLRIDILSPRGFLFGFGGFGVIMFCVTHVYDTTTDMTSSVAIITTTTEARPLIQCIHPHHFGGKDASR